MIVSKKNLFLLIIFFLSLILIFILTSNTIKNKLKLFKDDLIDKYHLHIFNNDHIKVGKNKYKLKKIKLPPAFDLFPVGYVEAKDDTVYLISGIRNTFFYEVNKNIIFVEIPNNLNKYHNIKSKDNWIEANVRDSLIIDNDIYLTLNSCEKKNNKIYCKMILVKSKLSKEKLIFEKIFETKKLLNNIDFTHSGGRITKYKEDKILIAIPEYGHPYESQNMNSYYGKIIEFNILTREANLFSYGHRNPQGLYYDFTRNIILESEHGPANGDEINLITKNANFGWPDYSYGGAQGIEKIIDKNHALNGASEPLKYFNSSIGPSQITKSLNNNEYVMASLRGNNGKKLFSFQIKKILNTIDDFQYFYVGDRIRDILNHKNKLYMIFENSRQLIIVN